MAESRSIQGEQFWKTTQLKKLFRYVRATSGNKVCITDLKKENLCNGNLEELLQSELATKYFFIQKQNEDSWEIRAKIDIQLCCKYQANLPCGDSCHGLHICKSFLLSSKECGVKCQNKQSHDLFDKHNEEILKEFSITRNEVEVIRASFPRFCEEFLKYGKCTRLSCYSLHLCPEFVLGNCIHVCKLEKKFKMSRQKFHGITSKHNTRIYKLYHFHQFSKELLNANVLRNDLLLFQNKISTYNNENEGKYVNKKKHLDGLHEKNGSVTMSRENRRNRSDNNGSRVTESKQDDQGQSREVFEKMKENKPEMLCKFHLYSGISSKSVPVKYLLDSTEPTQWKEVPEYSAYPSLCLKYAYKEKCFPSCQSLHLCPYFIIGDCRESSCSLSHAYTTAHNLQVFTKYKLDSLVKKGLKVLLAKQILSSNINFLEKVAYLEGCETRQLNGSEKAINKNRILDFVIDSDPINCSCSLENQQLLSNFNSNIYEAEKWFLKHHSYFRISTNLHGKKTVHVCLVDVEPCEIYWTQNGCKDDNCGKFHVCQKLMFMKHNANTCKYKHSFDDERSVDLIMKNNIKHLSTDQVLGLLKNRFPFVCEEYQNHHCKVGSKYCESLHVCKDYMLNKCTDASLCSKLHEKAFTSPQGQRICKNFGIQKEHFKRTVLIQRKTEVEVVVDKDAIIQFIMNKNPTFGDCNLNNEQLLDFFGDDRCKSEEWFKKYRSYFRMSTHIQQREKIVHVCLVDVEPCRMYWSQHGCTDDSCGKFHVCQKLMFRKHNANSCKYKHNFDDERSVHLLKKNNIQNLSTDQVVTLLKNRFPYVCDDYQNCNCQLGDLYCENLHICKDFMNHKCEKTFCGRQHEKGFESKQADRLCEVFCIKKNALAKSVLFEKSADVKLAVDKNNIIQFIMNRNPADGSFLLSNKQLLLYFDSNEFEAEQWFRKNPSFFRISCSDKLIKTVHVCLVDVEPCRMYWSQSGCTDDNCGKFHVCQKLMFTKHPSNSCKYNHNFEDKRSIDLLKKNSIQNLSSDQIIAILKNRFPYACEDYQSDNCNLGYLYCEHLHVCKDYMLNKCIDSSCSKQHSQAFVSSQGQRICRNFGIQKENLKRTILMEYKLASDLDNFNAFKSEAICTNNLEKKCLLGEMCDLVHYDAVYIWQKKDTSNSPWIKLPKDMSEKIERHYCDPFQSSYNFLIMSETSKKNLSLTINFDKEHLTGCFKDITTSNVYRRLSTKSNICNESKEMSKMTDWKWYWKKSSTEWGEFSTEIDNKQIESEFLAGKRSNKFETSKCSFTVDFQHMLREDQDGSKKDVLRRPVFTKKSGESECIFPKTWPENFPPGHLIDVSGSVRNDIESRFRSTIGINVNIIRIQEVCNKFFYSKYSIKKQAIEATNRDAGEKFLYHGTSPETIPSILAQNFDFRVCGRNGTAYGKGTYFAVSASVSHGYSARRQVNDQYLMIIGQVITGRHVQGNSSYTRPPPLGSGSLELYDSCVDNVNNPSMYIIFDRDQCYPRYLITYKI